MLEGGNAPADGGFAAATIIAAASDLYYVCLPSHPGCVDNGPFNLMRIPLGGGQPTLLATATNGFRGSALTGTSLIVGETNPTGDAIISVPLNGGPPSTVVTLPFTSLTSARLGSGFATDGTFVYFGDTQGGVEAMPLAPDSGSPAMVTLTTDVPDGLGVFAQQLIVALPQGGVESVPLPPQANSPVTMLGTAGSAPQDLFPCGSDECWFTEAPNALWKIDLVVGQPTTIATLTGPLAAVRGVVFDATNFYVIGYDSAFKTASLGRVPADGGCPVFLVTMPPWGSVAVDDECVYWANSQGIFNLAKTAQGPFAQ